jgi:dTDP-4-dehydrorhamnose reductase
LILILGASGFIGKKLAAAYGADAVGTHRSHPGLNTVYYDATQMQLSDLLSQLGPMTHAVILYAEARIDACKANPDRSNALNVTSLMNIINGLVRRGIKPVFTSSEYVFNGEKGYYCEDDPPCPNTLYGRQKLKMEKYLAELADDYLIFRLAKVFGSDYADGTILTGWAKQIQNGKTIQCARDQIFSPIHVDNVVEAIQTAIRLNLSGLYHVANTEPCSRLQMLRTLIGYADAKADVVECNLRDLSFLDNRPLNLSMDPSKLIRATGIKLRSINSCCEETARGLASVI